MSYCITFTSYPLSTALPYSRGGRSEAQHNLVGFIPQTLLAIWGPGGKNKISLKVLPGSGHARCLCFTTLSAPRARFVSTKRRTTSSNPVNYHGFCTSGRVPPPPAQDPPETPIRKSFGVVFQGRKKSSKKKVLKAVTARLHFRGNFAPSLASLVVGPRGIENGPKQAEKCPYLIVGYVG